jgi:hypothetical protein
MKDFTPKQAQQWVEQEQAKHKTIESLRQRISSEKQMMALSAQMPGMPNSANAHKDLHDKLVARLAALESTDAQVPEQPSATTPSAPAQAGRHIGGSILPSSDPHILKPLQGLHGTFQVRPLPEFDTHGLFFDERLLVTHANGYSCHSLAARILAVWSGTRDVQYAMEQFDYILACGGKGLERTDIEQIALKQPGSYPDD